LEGDRLPAKDYAKVFTLVTGKKTRYDSISLQVLAHSGIPRAEDLVPMYGWFDEFKMWGNTGKYDPSIGKKIFPSVSNWETFLRRTGWDGTSQT